MDAASRQQALNDISPEDFAKVQAHQAKTTGAFKVDNEWLLLCEFTKAFGWQAYIDAREDKVSIEEMATLVAASRKLEYSEMFRFAQAAFVGAISAQARKPSQTFKSLTKDIINKAKAD